MLGETIKEARIRKNLTQARLAKLAGVSRRHLAALEKGANVSINILQRVAQVLDLTAISFGTDLAVRSSEPERSTLNVPLLADTIREARAEAHRAQVILARAETLLGGNGSQDGAHAEVTFPRMPIRRISQPTPGNGGVVREGPEWAQIVTAGEIRHGDAINEESKETLAFPPNLVEEGEIVFRARGDNMRDQGIEDGDLLIVELRPRGRAASGELVIGRIGKQIFVGRWWQKHGQKALMSNGLSEVTLGRSARSLKIVAAVNQIVRL
ncbi:MAG TPA: helix-turn-helix domain-containing protein [Thermoanaerobaculia bacterium]|nr:helix-turn-helix domain-containing protein [Thermoanaerobaculia bacterium]